MAEWTAEEFREEYMKVGIPAPDGWWPRAAARLLARVQTLDALLREREAEVAALKDRVEWLERSIREALSDLPDKGADAQETLRDALRP